MKDRIEVLAQHIGRSSGVLTHVIDKLKEDTKKKEAAEERMENARMAKELVISVAEKTQANVGKRVSNLVSLALASVFDDPYTFEIEFVQRRNQTEADLWFVRDGNKIEPLTASGGGPVDVASLALRLAVWTLAKTAPVFLLDEPFRNLSIDKHEQAGLMLEKLSKKLGVQIIMVSHNPAVIAGADRVFRIENGKVKVEQ